MSFPIMFLSKPFENEINSFYSEILLMITIFCTKSKNTLRKRQISFASFLCLPFFQRKEVPEIFSFREQQT